MSSRLTVPVGKSRRVRKTTVGTRSSATRTQSHSIMYNADKAFFVSTLQPPYGGRGGLHKVTLAILASDRHRSLVFCSALPAHGQLTCRTTSTRMGGRGPEQWWDRKHVGDVGPARF
ncbi:hypothetical protein PAXRUDRAFT_649063 [Paxillus rubicundulus Ve08.2h10]|uniref:Uncharacterized protein n=1 Tax=Paxillus rubicundulus Ve08.2h10 TaxID=930991 RepID=A0A0D0DSH0_9AGAM|nr:hypothetical protein PAXRUDRAFT_649063 [Paxillus rubicundulus Ve08.2h10]